MVYLGRALLKGKYIHLFSGFWSTLMLNFPLTWKSIALNIYRSINATWYPKFHLSIKIISRRLLNSSTHLENSFLLLLMILNLSSMNLINISGILCFSVCILYIILPLALSYIYLLVLVQDWFSLLFPWFAGRILLEISLRLL